MSSVELGDSFESGGYFVHVATAFHHDSRLAWAEFKLDMKYGDGYMQVLVYGHRVPGTSGTKLASIEAGCKYAYRMLAKALSRSTRTRSGGF